MPLLSGTVQPSLLTLLSSTSSPALSPLWRAHTGDDESSFLTVLNDTEYPRADVGEGSSTAAARQGALQLPRGASQSRARNPAVHVPNHPQRGGLACQVLHIQSKSPDTYIEIGGSVAQRNSGARDGGRRTVDHEPLEATLPWLGVHLKALGARGVAIEIGLVDTRGREGAVRLCSWVKEPNLKTRRTPPLVTLPLALPSLQGRATDWLELSLHLAPFLPLFRTLHAIQSKQVGPAASAEDTGKRKRAGADDQVYFAALPDSQFASVSYIRVYANCRLRRVWLAADGQRSVDALGAGAYEWALYGAEP